MATLPAMERPGLTWHERGTWKARDDRFAFAVWLGLLWLGMVAGFGLDFPRYLRETPPAPIVVHVHAVVFSGWLLLLTAQVLLVLRERVPWHRKLGWVAAGWACLMGVLGPWAAMASKAVELHGPRYNPPFLAINFVEMAGFIALLGWGIALRRNPAAHKRMMILATVSLAGPGFSRVSGWLIPAPTGVVAWFFWSFYGNLVLILLMAGWDWWRGRLMRQFAVGAALLLGTEFVSVLVYFWGPWKTLTASWVDAWARHFA
jgi:hypothetical protein